MTYYNAFTTSEGTRMTKWDEGLNILSSYVLTQYGCSCPAHGYCRHREMLNHFILYDKVDTDWFLNYETGYWERPVSYIMTGKDRPLRRPAA